MSQLENYKPISDYAPIGNLRSVALVGLDGSIDWCCFPHLDRASVFGALLDAQRGGRFSVGLRAGSTESQSYFADTNILKTRMASDAGILNVVDWMPLAGNIHKCGESSAASEIYRLLECERGEVEVEVEWSPRFDYARALVDIEKSDGGWVATGGGERMSLGWLEEGEIRQAQAGPELHARFTLRAGEQRLLVTRWGSSDTSCNLEHAAVTLQRTFEIWREWVHREGTVHSDVWAGEWLPLILRSSLLCKLLSHADTGAIAAAPTTSLPEAIGGSRNWDYRYTWIRDASQTAQALMALGHTAEAVEFLHWLERVSAGRSLLWEPQIMYGVHGEAELHEEELSHLEGYRGSRPVRIGNGAADQFQLEVYGELLNMGYELIRRGEKLEPVIMNFLPRVAEYVHRSWERPDSGIWEVRGPARHFTYSKVMAWVAMDRAVHLVQNYEMQGEVEKWSATRDRIRDVILEHGYDQELGAFVQAFGSKELDAANLRIPLVEFLPADDPRIQGTINRTLERLTENGLVYRYHSDDGLVGGEGTFCLCTFWLVDALALSGRVQEAQRIFDGLIRRANHVGLFSEEIDARTGEFLGNFPQAFTHIGLINSALYLAYALGRRIPHPFPIGTPEHRRMVGR